MGNAQAKEFEDGSEDFVDELKPGTQLMHGQYTIERFLNAGGFGITYLAKDSLDRKIVIKECFPGAFCRRSNVIVQARSRAHQTELQSIVRLFVQEAKSLAKLDHPNIVGVHQVFEDNDTAYMALDFVEGRDLLDTLEDPKSELSADQVRSILTDILGAVGFIHKQGILHRDISPDNILLGPDMRPVLIDFGAAREEATQKSRVLSALRVVKDGYSPQEFYIAGSEQNESSDLYALGASFYHLITGETPPNAQARLAAIASGEADPYKKLGSQTSAFDDNFLGAVDKSLEVLPKNRVQNAQEWLDLMTGKVVSAPAASPVEAAVAATAPAKEGKSKMGLLMASAAVVALVGVGVATQTDILGGEAEPVADTEVAVAVAAPVDGGRIDSIMEFAQTRSEADQFAAQTAAAEAAAAAQAAAEAEAREVAAALAAAEAQAEEGAAALAAAEAEAAAQAREVAAALAAAEAEVAAARAAAEAEAEEQAREVAVALAAAEAEAQAAAAALAEANALAAAEAEARAVAEAQAAADAEARLIAEAQAAEEAGARREAEAAAAAASEARIAAEAKAEAEAEAAALAQAAAEAAALAAATPDTPLPPLDRAVVDLPSVASATSPGLSTDVPLNLSGLGEPAAFAGLSGDAIIGVPFVPANTDTPRTVGGEARASAFSEFGATAVPSTSEASTTIALPVASAEYDATTLPITEGIAAFTPGNVIEEEVVTPADDSLLLSAWSVVLPFGASSPFSRTIDEVATVAPVWVQNGVQIVSVNGQPVDTISTINDTLRKSVTLADQTELVVDFGILDEATGTVVDKRWLVPVVHHTALLNGVSFETRLIDDTWRTVVTAAPEPAAGELQVGDQLIGYMATSERLEGRTSLKDIMDREIAAGTSQFTFAVQREGSMWIAAIEYANNAQ